VGNQGVNALLGGSRGTGVATSRRSLRGKQTQRGADLGVSGAATGGGSGSRRALNTRAVERLVDISDLGVAREDAVSGWKLFGPPEGVRTRRVHTLCTVA
jgi:hypothetical protein